MSVDIIGSTAFKQGVRYKDASPEDEQSFMQPWIEHFTAFFVEFSEVLNTAWNDSWRNLPGPMKEYEGKNKPSFWKGAGDEAIYTLDLESPQQAYIAIYSFRAAMQKYRSALQGNEETKKLDIKGTAWLAGFPVNNAEVVLGYDLNRHAPVFSSIKKEDKNIAQLILRASGSLDDGYRDFLGPQIDLGFRLAKFSSTRRLVISVDLACILSEMCGLDWQPSYDPKLRFEKTETLKGVLSGQAYPIIWCDADPDNELNKEEDKVRGIEPLNPEIFKNYCEAFINQANLDHPWAISPFIKSPDGKEVYGKEPPLHEEDYRKYKNRWNVLCPRVLGSEVGEPEEEAQADAFKSFVDKALEDNKPTNP